MDSGLVRSLSSGRASRGPVGTPRNDDDPVGWVERSDTHHVANGADEFRGRLNPSCCLLICRHGKSNPGIELRQINPTGKSLLIFRNRVKPRNQKYFTSRSTQISSLIRAVLPTEGRAHVTNAERDAVDAAASGARMRAGRMMLMRTAKSCGSDAPMLASSLR